MIKSSEKPIACMSGDDYPQISLGQIWWPLKKVLEWRPRADKWAREWSLSCWHWVLMMWCVLKRLIIWTAVAVFSSLWLSHLGFLGLSLHSALPAHQLSHVSISQMTDTLNKPCFSFQPLLLYEWVPHSPFLILFCWQTLISKESVLCTECFSSSPKLVCWSPNTQCDAAYECGLWEVIRL